MENPNGWAYRNQYNPVFDGDGGPGSKERVEVNLKAPKKRKCGTCGDRSRWWPGKDDTCPGCEVAKFGRKARAAK